MSSWSTTCLPSLGLQSLGLQSLEAALEPSVLLAQTRVYYQWARFEQLDQWWHYLIVLLILVAVVAYVFSWYRRDSHEQQRPVRWALLILRLVAFAGLLLYFFQLDKRSELRVTRNSRVAVLVDTSLSMTLPGTPSASGITSNLSRADEAAKLIAGSPALDELAKQHDVTVYRFDQLSRPIQVASLVKPSGNAPTGATQGAGELVLLSRAHTLMIAACIMGAIALALIAVSFSAQIVGARAWSGGGWSLFGGSLLALAGMGLLAGAILPSSDYPLEALFLDPEVAASRFDAPLEGDLGPTVTQASGAAPNANAPSDDNGDATGGSTTGTQLPGDWRQALAPSGIETRMGDAIKAVLDREQGGPLAAIVCVTDGRNNAGLDPRSLVLSVQNARVPLIFVGVGSEQNPPNMKIVEVDAPKRIYPGDKFTLTALLQGMGFSGQSVNVQVSAGPKDSDPSSYSIEAEEQVSFTTDDELVTASFELEPKAVGQWTYQVKIFPSSSDVDERDNAQQTAVAVIERKNRVLIFAGGPMREYQFVRNLLFRDRDVESHVLLQTGRTGMSQEAGKLLDEFPADRAALSQYDAILAFDADWTKVSDAQCQALEQWVAEQAGGLLMVAGPVEMPKWLARSAGGERSTILRSLSPVKLQQSGSRVLTASRVESEKPWPLKITNDGLQSDFMWLSEDPQTSARLWSEFEGVYTFYSAYELKPGAKALAWFNDPTAAEDGNLPIYLASQFYGAGRVVYQGGGEIWRLRELGDQYFDRYYTKLVRWISQGRLLMDSDRGVLLVDREQALLGDQVAVRAVLKDERFQPLVQSEVVARLLDPQKRNLPLVLRPLDGGAQPGVYTGQFPAQIAGEYTVQLQLGGLSSNEVLSASVKARVPAVEMQRAERNDDLLLPLATQSGGRYFKGVESAIAASETDRRTALAAAIEPQDQVSFLPGVPNRRFQLRWLGWLMGLIAGCLSIEWFARRLHRLA